MAERADLRIAQRRLPIITAAAAILAIVATLSFVQHIREVQDRYDKIDFCFFYGWWTDYSGGGDPWMILSQQSELRPGLLRPRNCNYPPLFVEVFSPLARLGQKTAFWLWESLQIMCLLAAVMMLARGNAPPLGAAATIIVLSLVTLSRQFGATLACGQFTPMLLALLCASWFSARRERPAAAGLCLALAALLKLYPAAVGGYFLFRRRWRPLLWAIGCFVAGVMLTNPARWIELFRRARLISSYNMELAGLTVFPVVQRSVAHFAGTPIDAAPALPVYTITALIDLALLAIGAAVTIPGRQRPGLDGLLFGLWVALALLISPLAWIHETLVLLPVYLFGMLAAWEGFRRHDASPSIALIAGSATLALCIVTALIKAVPHPWFAVLLAAYLGAALILRARMQPDSPD